MFENHQTDARTKPLPDVSPTMGSERNAQPSNNNPLVVTGIDLYNQAETGGVSMPVTAAASDSHHVPCVATGFSHANGNTSMETRPEPECAFTIRRSPAGEGAAIIATAIRTAQTGANGCGISDEAAHTLDRAEGQEVAELAGEYVVRRLTPRECERLQGFPDDWTRIPYRGKPAEDCPDAPRYKAMGNSWGTNCAEWILRRILAARPVWHPEPDEPSTTERIP